MAETTSAVIGAGIGGLIAAIELASAGRIVHVFEAADDVGGKARVQTVDGRPINAGPTVLTLADVFEATLSRARTRLSDELSLKPADVLARHAWPDASRLDLFADPTRAEEAIRVFAGAKDAEGFRRFRADAARASALMDKPFLRASKPSMARLMTAQGPKSLATLLRINPFATLWQALARYFDDPRLRQLFARYATYTGSDPFQASASLMLIADVEQAGVWQIDGGMHALALALANVARRCGVVIECARKVRRIETDHAGVCALTFADGRQLATRQVVCSADIGALVAGQLGPSPRRAIKHAQAVDEAPALSGVTWACVARTAGFPLSHHNVFFGNDYAGEFNAIFSQRALPQDPTVYVCAEDRFAAADEAQDGLERLLCLANAPSVDARGAGPSDEDIAAYRDRVWQTFARAGLDVKIEAVRCTGPADFAHRFPGSRGALYGRAAHGPFSPFARPSARSRIRGLYLAGGNVHPGAGLPMVALSGQHAAAALLQDLQ